MKALILAGGKGVELLPLTANLPKPVVPVGNIPFVFYQLAILKEAGIKEVIISLSYLPRRIKDILDDGSRYGMIIRYTTEPIPLGTAGAIKNAADMIDGPLVVLNGDILTAIELQEVIDWHQRKKDLATLVTGRAIKPARYGVVMFDRQHQVTGFIDKPREHEVCDDHSSVGIYVFEQEILDYIPPRTYCTLERETFPQLVAANQNVHQVGIDDYWLDIGDPPSYLQANMDVMSGRVPLPKFYGLFEKIDREYPSSCRIDDKSFIEEPCQIKSGVEIENSVIGRNCRLEENVRIKDSVILPGTRIQKNTSLRYCLVGHYCVIGESAYINKGAVLGDKTTVADFSRL